uniref:Uncharacterized protein n=1 Tax=Rhodopseudomonas palustris (strain BisA53) TaxID=316055 RepID=Q07H08_RHOP5
MRLIILLGTIAIAMPFAIPFLAPPCTVGTAVSERFLERSNTIPYEIRKTEELTDGNLKRWVTAADTAKFAEAYAWRMIPLDLIFLAALGSFLAIGAYTLASLGLPAPLSRLPLWAWLILPLTYVVVDLLEDILIIVLMTTPDVITGATVTTLTVLRTIKIWSVGLAMAQLILLGVSGGFWGDHRPLTPRRE